MEVCKNGRKNDVQMFRCKACGRQFCKRGEYDWSKAYASYVSGRRTRREIAEMLGVSERTVKRKMDAMPPDFVPYVPEKSVVLTDTTYFGRNWGVMIFLDSESGRALHRKFVKNESNALYLEGLEEIKRRGTEILGVVCDGRPGLLSAIDFCPVQMCRFHMLQIIRRKTTDNPKTEAAKELLSLAKGMFYASKEKFVGEFDGWKARWCDFLKEKRTDCRGRKYLVHKNLWSAKRSLERHLPWLFTSDEFGAGMPSTTNAIEGLNSEMKRLLSSHNGLGRERKMKFIDYFLAHYGE